MKKKMGGILLLLASLVIIFTLPTAYAGENHKARQRGHGLEKKILHKLHLVIANRDELNLSDTQVAKSKELKIKLKKDLISRKAEIDLIGVDIKCELWDDVIDKKAISNLIDQKYELKKAKAKSLVEALVKLKSILTEEQEKKLKDIRHRRHRVKHKDS
jgi:Spy/CpxP family protein refolding chaperone